MFGFILGVIAGIALERFGHKYINMGVVFVKGWFNKLDSDVTAKDEAEAKDETESK